MDSIDKIKSSITDMESSLSTSLSKFLTCDEVNINSLSSDLEWFLTWRIKLEDLENRMWCDGVRDLNLLKTSSNTVSLEGVAYIGPESDVTKIYKSKLKGNMCLSNKHNLLESYSLCVEVNGKSYEINK